MSPPRLRMLAVVAPFLLGGALYAQDNARLAEGTPASTSTDARTGLHFQFTTVTQFHPSFDARYSGKNSLSTESEHETTVTSTLSLGARLWGGAELYVDPELSGGSGLSRALGVAGFPNGESFRVGDSQPRLSIARAMLRQTIAAGAETEEVPEEANQLGGRRPVRRWTITAGKFGIGDFFDDNAYSHDPRTQFMNWADWTAGAWDYSADTRGYTWGFVVEYNDARWAARAAATAQPRLANGLEFDKHPLDAYALSGEFERRYELGDEKGTARLILFYNRAHMGSYREAIDGSAGQTPDITATRRTGRSKWGFVVNLEQALGPRSGLFLRGSWNDGHNESWAYAEIDRSVTAGALRKAPLKLRPDDEAGVALIVNGISRDHRDYLAAGGYGFMIGDGRLSYGLETIGEGYYQAALRKHVWLAVNYQFIEHPAYNRDRGPVHVVGARLHAEF
ncbi:MAG: carbohydrate porin [Acidobacteriota bacterium]